MDLKHFISKIPYLYHLTDARNVKNIIKEKKILSTVKIFEIVGLPKTDQRLFQRRKEHLSLIGVKDYHIRDQRPLNKALKNCLVDGCSEEEFIYLLNSRAFFWPNLKRLNIHFGRYENENPLILRFETKDILTLNLKRVELSRINSGATRCSGKLGGKAAARGKNTFQSLETSDIKFGTIAEVTVLNVCHIPDNVYLSKNPDGPWEKLYIDESL